MKTSNLRRRLFCFYTRRTGLVIVNPVAPMLREDSKDLEPAPPKLDAGKAAKGVTIPSRGGTVVRRKPHNTDFGYVASRRHPRIKGVPGERGEGWVVIYEAAEQGLDPEGGRYAVVCNSHGIIINDTSLRGARASMKWPANFCEECRNLEHTFKEVT